MVGNTVLKAKEKLPEVPSDVIASASSVIAGCIIVIIGLIRCGWIIEFISLTAISAFMTGSALNIAVGQLPALMGIAGFSTREATYKVLINTFRHLGQTKIDAAMGLTSLLLLYIIRAACNHGAERMPHRRKTFFFLATLRNAFVLLIYTMVSWLVNRNRRTKPLFKILSNVRRGKALDPLFVCVHGIDEIKRVAIRPSTDCQQVYHKYSCGRPPSHGYRAPN